MWSGCPSPKNSRKMEVTLGLSELQWPNRSRKHAKFPVVATLWDKNDLVFVGYAQPKTHPMQKRFQCEDVGAEYLHAEMDAIQKALKSPYRGSLGSLAMVVARVKKTSPKGSLVPANAKPCPACQKALDYYGIRKVEHT